MSGLQKQPLAIILRLQSCIVTRLGVMELKSSKAFTIGLRNLCYNIQIITSMVMIH